MHTCTHLIQLARLIGTTERSVAHREKNACIIRFGRMGGGGGRKGKRNKPLSPSSQMFSEHYRPPKWTASSQWCNKGYDFPFRGWEVQQPPWVRTPTSALCSYWIHFVCLLSSVFLYPSPFLSLSLCLTELLGQFLLIGVNAESNCAHMG